jgi:hypothetical protein
MGDRQSFLKGHHASLFNDDLSIESNFGQIHLTGQYLLTKFKSALSWKSCSEFEHTIIFTYIILICQPASKRNYAKNIFLITVLSEHSVYFDFSGPNCKNRPSLQTTGGQRGREAGAEV